MDWLKKGGPLMYPILICSIFALAIFVERLIALMNKDSIYSNFRAYLHSIIEETRADLKGFREIFELAIDLEVRKLSKGLGTLSLIAKISTLLGLLGTVLGMVEVFKKVSEGKLGDPAALAGGIWVALLTTVFGLSVAIPATLMHSILSSIVSKIEERLLKISEEVLKGVATKGGGS
ncbi:MAG: biopolymer transport protein ExbB [bacterium]|nr:biopolymer transport protein ExbB [bacterium]